jgi:inosine-uridine nucleoside N-ribohydrolase
MQFRQQGKPPLGVIFDCDMGNSIDDALALALLYGLDGKGEARMVSISVSKSNLKAAALAEAIGRFYGGAVTGAFAAVGRTLPIGLNDDGKMAEETPMLTVPLAKKTPKGQPVYEHGIYHPYDTADAAALVRNALTSQHDQNCVVVCAGPATNLTRAMSLPGVPEMITKKAKSLVIMGGAYPEGGPEFNIKSDIPAAKKLFAEWPGQIVASGFELGEKLMFPGESIEKDFAWSPNHPVVDAYRAYKAMPYDTPTWDLTAALYAIRPQENYFKLSPPGTIQVFDDGRTKFTASESGRHRYLIFDPEQKDRIVKTYIELASAKPVERRRPFRTLPQQQQQKKQAEPPKPEAQPQE